MPEPSSSIIKMSSSSSSGTVILTSAAPASHAISNQLCERNFRRLGDGPESAHEEVLLEEAALQWLNLGNSVFAGLHTCLVHENTITIAQVCKGCHIASILFSGVLEFRVCGP